MKDKPDSSHSRGHTDTAPDCSPAAGRREAPAATRRGPGAQPGNANARTHGAYASDLNAQKRAKRRTRDRYRQKAERDAKEVLAAYGIADDPLARIVAHQMARLETIADRLESHHGNRGYFTARGELKASVSKEVEVIGKLLDEARKLLEQFQEHAASNAQPSFRIEYVEPQDDEETAKRVVPSPPAEDAPESAPAAETTAPGDAAETESVPPVEERSAASEEKEHHARAQQCAKEQKGAERSEPTGAERYGWIDFGRDADRG